MIIKCNNCDKKFEVNSSLIPEKGRTIQCGSCDHTWFYIPDLKTAPQILTKKSFTEETPEQEILDKKVEHVDVEDQANDTQEEILINKDILNDIDNGAYIEKVSKTSANSSLSKFLAYFFVGIISFTALIIILETFKSPLSDVFPKLELLLYNLFESIEDLFLFINDLLI